MASPYTNNIFFLGNSQFDDSDAGGSNPFNGAILAFAQMLKADFYHSVYNYTYLSNSPTRPDWKVWNFGHGGLRADQLNTYISSEISPQYQSSPSGQQICVIEAGINDFANQPATTAAAVKTRIDTLVSDLLTACPNMTDVYVLTLFGYNGTGGAGSATANTRRLELNTLLKASPPTGSTIIDIVPADDSPDLDNADNTTWFNGTDKTHLTRDGKREYAERIYEGVFGAIVGSETISIADSMTVSLPTTLGAAQYKLTGAGSLSGSALNKTYTPAGEGVVTVEVMASPYARISQGNSGGTSGLNLQTDGSMLISDTGLTLGSSSDTLRPRLSAVGDFCEATYHTTVSPSFVRHFTAAGETSGSISTKSYGAQLQNGDTVKFTLLAGNLIEFRRIRAATADYTATASYSGDVTILPEFGGIYGSPANGSTLSSVWFGGSGVKNITKRTITITIDRYPDPIVVRASRPKIIVRGSQSSVSYEDI